MNAKNAAVVVLALTNPACLIVAALGLALVIILAAATLVLGGLALYGVLAYLLVRGLVGKVEFARRIPVVAAENELAVIPVRYLSPAGWDLIEEGRELVKWPVCEVKVADVRQVVAAMEVEREVAGYLPGPTLQHTDANQPQAGAELYVASPRVDARRPGKVGYTYKPYVGGTLSEGQYLAVKVGKKYVPQKDAAVA